MSERTNFNGDRPCSLRVELTVDSMMGMGPPAPDANSMMRRGDLVEKSEREERVGMIILLDARSAGGEVERRGIGWVQDAARCLWTRERRWDGNLNVELGEDRIGMG
jgi:hypothetical protein